ncbi:MAG: hypothetical protein RLZZ385_1695 [Pseudomonadota bacterium]|jgi:RNA-binding protein
MTANQRDRKTLKAIGHGLKPIVTVAENGLSPNVLAEIQRALHQHELIKIKVLVADRGEKQAIQDELTRMLNAECLQKIGHVMLLYRATEKPDPRLSNVLRFKQLV